MHGLYRTVQVRRRKHHQRNREPLLPDKGLHVRHGRRIRRELRIRPRRRDGQRRTLAVAQVVRVLPALHAFLRHDGVGVRHRAFPAQRGGDGRRGEGALLRGHMVLRNEHRAQLAADARQWHHDVEGGGVRLLRPHAEGRRAHTVPFGVPAHDRDGGGRKRQD